MHNVYLKTEEGSRYCVIIPEIKLPLVSYHFYVSYARLDGKPATWGRRRGQSWVSYERHIITPYVYEKESNELPVSLKEWMKIHEPETLKNDRYEA